MSPLRARSALLFSLAVTLIAAWALWESRGWPIKTALYPRAIGIPLLLLAAAESVLSVRSKEAGPVLTPMPETRTIKEVMDVALPSEVPQSIALRRTAQTAVWLIAFLVAVFLIGFPRSIPLFVLVYLRGQGKERWSLSIILAVAAWGIFHLLFIRLLHLPFADGLLWGTLFR